LEEEDMKSWKQTWGDKTIAIYGLYSFDHIINF